MTDYRVIEMHHTAPGERGKGFVVLHAMDPRHGDCVHELTPGAGLHTVRPDLKWNNPAGEGQRMCATCVTTVLTAA